MRVDVTRRHEALTLGVNTSLLSSFRDLVASECACGYFSWSLEAVTVSSRPVVSHCQQVWFGQLSFGRSRLSLDLLGSCSAVEMRGMFSFSHARPRTVPEPCFSVCAVPHMDHGMILPLFLSISGRHSPRPVVRRKPSARSQISEIPERVRTAHYLLLRSTHVRKARCCVPCLRQEMARSGHVEEAVASGHRAQIGTPRAQARGHARLHGPGPVKLKPDAVRPEESVSREQPATGGARF